MTGTVTGATAASVANIGTVSPSKVFWATWFGWMLDGFDSSMYSYILVGGTRRQKSPSQTVIDGRQYLARSKENNGPLEL
jgi:hypothetical protein